MMNLFPRLKAEISKRKRMDPTPIDLDGQALHALPNPGKMSVSGASNLPSVLARRLDRGEPSVIMANAARSRMQHDLQLALSSPSTSSVASSNIRFDKKALDFDTIKHSGEVEVRHSKHQRVSPTLFTMNDQEFSALPILEEAPVWAASNAPFVLVKRLGIDPATVIMNNAVNFIKHHDFRLTPPGSFPTSAAAPVDRLNHKLITQKALKFGMTHHLDELYSHLNGHHLHLQTNDKSAHPATVGGQSFPEAVTIEVNPRVREPLPVTADVKKIHKAFLEAFNLPFHQYPVETAMMIKMAERQFHASPSNGHFVAMLATLVNQQSYEDL